MNRPKEWQRLPMPIKEILISSANLINSHDAWYSEEVARWEMTYQVNDFPEYEFFDENNFTMQKFYDALSDTYLEKLAEDRLHKYQQIVSDLTTFIYG